MNAGRKAPRSERDDERRDDYERRAKRIENEKGNGAARFSFGGRAGRRDKQLGQAQANTDTDSERRQHNFRLREQNERQHALRQ
jgi:hypothetical protein